MKSILNYSVLFLLFSCVGESPDRQQISKLQSNAVIYGEDNRFDYSEISDVALKNLARSTVALISSEHLVYDNVFDVFHLEKPDFGLNMCSKEKFLS